MHLFSFSHFDSIHHLLLLFHLLLSESLQGENCSFLPSMIFFFFPSFFALFRDSEFSEKVELIDFLTLLLFRILPFEHSQCCRSLMSDSFDISLQQIDEWIDQVSQCNTLSENDIKLLCEKVFRTCLVASLQSYSECFRPRRFFAKNQTFNPLVHPLRSAAMFMASSTT